MKTNGLIAVSALDEFGTGGLANLAQEETYVKLCNKGIDAVITIALLDGKKEKVFGSFSICNLQFAIGRLGALSSNCKSQI